MWYCKSQTQTSKPSLNKGGYNFIMPKGNALPWHKNIKLDGYSKDFIDWKNSQLNPANKSAGEGGLKNWSESRGGLTNKGITQKEYDAFRKSQNQKTQSVEFISQAEVDQILYRNYWARLNAENLPPMVAKVVTTYGLLAGAEEAASELQKIVKKFIPAQEITGNIYNQTAKNVRKLSTTKQQEYSLTMSYFTILRDKLLSQKGMGGYKARMDNLKKMIDDLYLTKKSPSEVSEIQTDIEQEINSLPLV